MFFYSTRLRYLSSILLGAEEVEEVVVVVAEEVEVEVVDTATVLLAVIPSDSDLEEGTATDPLLTGHSSTNNNRDPPVAVVEEEEVAEEEGIR